MLCQPLTKLVRTCALKEPIVVSLKVACRYDCLLPADQVTWCDFFLRQERELILANVGQLVDAKGLNAAPKWNSAHQKGHLELRLERRLLLRGLGVFGEIRGHTGALD